MLKFPNFIGSGDQKDDGQVFFRNANFYIGDTAPTLQSVGDVVFWQKGQFQEVLYDDFNGAIDPTKWTTSTTATKDAGAATAVVSETATYVQGYCTATAATNPITAASFTTKILTAPSLMNRIEFRFTYSETGGSGGGGNYRILGGTWRAFGGATDVDVLCTKDSEGKWTVYEDEVLVLAAYTPVSGDIDFNTTTFASGAGITYTTTARMYEMTVNKGGTAMLVKDQFQTLQVELAPLNTL